MTPRPAAPLLAGLLTLATTGLTGGCASIPRQWSPGAATHAPALAPVSGTAAIGEMVRYPDGMTVSALRATAFRLSRNARGGQPRDPAVRIDVSLRNGTAQPFSAERVRVQVSLGRGSAKAVQDPIQGITLAGFSGRLAAGAEATRPFGFAVGSAGTDSLRVTVTPALGDYSPVTFTGRA